MSADANSTAQARNRSSFSSGKNSVGLDCTILKARSSFGVPSSQAQSKAIVSFFSRITSQRASSVARSAGSMASVDRDPAVLLEEGDVVGRWPSGTARALRVDPRCEIDSQRTTREIDSTRLDSTRPRPSRPPSPPTATSCGPACSPPAEVAEIVDDCERLVDDLVRDRAGPPDEGRQLRVRPRLRARRDHQVGGRHRRRARHRAVRAPQPGVASVGARRPLPRADVRHRRLRRPDAVHREAQPQAAAARRRQPAAPGLPVLGRRRRGSRRRSRRRCSSSTTRRSTTAACASCPAATRRACGRRRTDGDEFAGNEIDGDAYADVESVPRRGAGRVGRDVRLVPRAPLGSRTRPTLPRRALLFSYQPPGAPHMLESLRRLGATADRS